jgi:hypothetical protein
MRIDSSLATGAKVFLKSKPVTWPYPFATSQALFLVTTAYSSCLLQNTHLVPNILVRTWHQAPHFIPLEVIEFLLHGQHLVRIL